MNNSKIQLYSLLHSLGVIAYIALIVLLMNSGDRLFGEMDNFWGPLAMLLLFTVSAAITGLLVFGRPIYLFLNDQKKEAVQFTMYTVGWLVLEALVVFIVLFLIRG